MSRQSNIANNQALLEQFQSRDSNLQKEAANSLTGFLRIRSREDGILRRLLPPEAVTAADFDRQVDTNKPAIVRDMEPASAGAVSVPFGTTPKSTFMDTPRYLITFQRILSKKYSADVMNLQTYDVDLKEMFNDLLLKDITDEEDRKFIAIADELAGPVNDTQNSTSNKRMVATGARGWVTAGPISRASLNHASKALESTVNSLQTATMLVNNVTIKDMQGLTRDAIGGDMAEEILINGFKEAKLMDINLYVTIKKNLVPTDQAYLFSTPESLGDFCTAEDVVVSTEHKNFMFDMFAYECVGAAFANIAAAAKVSFTGSVKSWDATVA